MRFNSRTPNWFHLLGFFLLFLKCSSDLFDRKITLLSSESMLNGLGRARTHLKLLKIQSSFKCFSFFQKYVLVAYHSLYLASSNKRHYQKIVNLKT